MATILKQYRCWIILFAVALALRVGAAFYWESRCGADRLYFGDSDTYWVLGKAIADGAPYDYGGNRIHRMPGYPVVLAPLFLLFDSPPVMAGRLLNALIGALTVSAVGGLAWLLFRDRTLSLLAAWLSAVDPVNIIMSVLILSEAIFCFVMILQLSFWSLALQREGKIVRPLLLCSGIMAAACVYCRPSWLYFVPFAALLGIVLAPKSYKKIFVTGFAITAIAAICLMPWWYRNYRITGHFVSTTLQTGPSLYDGLHPEATGGSDMAFVEDFRNAEFRIGVNPSDATLEYRLNRKMREAAIRWVWKNPKLAWKLAGTKFVRLWNIWPNEKTLSNLFVNIALFVVEFPVLILGGIGAFRSLGKEFQVRLLWIPAVYITLLHVVFVSSIRYRVPAMFCLSILAAWILTSVVRAARSAAVEKRQKPERSAAH